MKFKSFKSTTYEYDRILVEIDIITMCNYHCWYCYARKRQQLWNKLMNLDKIKLIANRIAEYKGKVDVNLLGGEPLMHPKLDSILQILSDVHNVNEITITSNGSHDKTAIVAKYPKVKINISYHASEVELGEFVEILHRYDSIGKLNVVTVMMDQDYSEDITELLELKDLFRDTTFEQHYPILDGKFYDVYENDNDDFNKIFTIDDGEPMSYDEVLRRNLNRFKGCKCEVKRFGISIDGSIKENCRYSDLYNIFNGYRFEDKCMICDKEECTEYVTLQMPKEKD